MAEKDKACICERLGMIYGFDQPLLVRRKLAAKEKGVVYHANVVPERETAVFQVDGKIITEGNKCDKLVLSQEVGLKGSWRGHFIELKGTDVRHAVAQLESTINHAVFKDDSLSLKFARIVARSFPSSKADPFFEKARARFKKEYSCELKTLKSGQDDLI